MKNLALTLTAIVLGTARLAANELKETQYPVELRRAINVGGAYYLTSRYVKPWVAADPAEYNGKYESLSMTEGSTTLEIKLHEAKDDEGDLCWYVDGSLETIVGHEPHQLVTFKNAELREPKQPCFDFFERMIAGVFVIFTNPEAEEPTPQHALIIGENVFVLKEEKPAPGS